ncbi:cyclopropane-fatty-acyl-phospholipid synthase, partial [Tremellales sp. Uapishka_1]
MDYAYALLDKGYIPDTVLRPVIRQLCRQRLRDIDHGTSFAVYFSLGSLYPLPRHPPATPSSTLFSLFSTMLFHTRSPRTIQCHLLISRHTSPATDSPPAGSLSANHAAKMDFIADLYNRPIAIEQTKANEQHYEVPTSFLQLCLGPRMKYSSCMFPTPTSKLTDAEDAILSLYCTEAKLGRGLRGVGAQDQGVVGKEGEGLKILDLGCGWGSLGLFLAEHYPLAEITMLSNSKTQKVHIDNTAAERGYKNITVVTGDVNVYDFEEKEKFTHILSIEMFEHMKAYPTLFHKVSTWLQPRGLLFIHIFCHKSQPYHFEESSGWMAQTFFSGGTMPSLDLFTYFQHDLTLQRSWYLNGTHYARTLEAWLVNQDANKKEGLKILKEALGDVEGEKSFYRFRVFFMACAEFFGLDAGETWGVGRYLFEKK